eukprot:7111197-Prymnesium_polylepis.1
MARVRDAQTTRAGLCVCVVCAGGGRSVWRGARPRAGRLAKRPPLDESIARRLDPLGPWIDPPGGSIHVAAHR